MTKKKVYRLTYNPYLTGRRNYFDGLTPTSSGTSFLNTSNGLTFRLGPTYDPLYSSKLKLWDGSVNTNSFGTYATNNPTTTGTFNSSGITTPPPPKLGFGSKVKGFMKSNAGKATMSALGTALASLSAANKGGYDGTSTDILDLADPMYHLAGGRESTVGNTLSDTGKSVFLAGVSSGNPWIMLAGAGAKVAGGLVNTLFGYSVDKEGQKRLKSYQSQLNRLQLDDSSNASVVSLLGNISFGGVDLNRKKYKDGLLNSKGTEAWNRDNAAELLATYRGAAAGNNAIAQADTNMDLGIMANYSALGGPLGGGSVDYLLAADAINSYRDKSTSSGLTRMPLPPVVLLLPTFAFGGELGTNGADFSNGLIFIENGGSHEANPFEGVLMGVDQEGVPNLVEEGEVVYNDYVFSNRLTVPKAVRNKYKLRGNKSLTFADAAKKLSKESEERPNDPISLRGLEASLSDLMTALEEMRARRQSRKYAKGGRLGRRYENGGTYTDFPGRPQPEWVFGYNDLPTIPRDLNLVDPIEEIIRRKGISPERAVAFRRATFPGTPPKLNTPNEPTTVAYTGRYGLDWYNKQARILGISPDELKYSLLGNDDATNLAEFNRLATDYRRNKAESEWNIAQRLSMFNEDLLRGAIRRATGNSDNYYRANTWDTSGNGWINADWKYDPTKPTLGILTDEEYAALKDDDRKKYRRIIYNAGDKVIDYNGAVSWGTDALTADLIREGYTPTGFKWDEKNNVNLEFPDEAGNNLLTNLRYVPALGAGLGVVTDLLGLTNKPDYTPVDDILTAGLEAIREDNEVSYNPIGDYLTYNPFDRDYHINQLNYQAGATRRNLLNTAGGNRGTAAAGLLAADFNYLNSIGNLARLAEEYNLAQRQSVETFNRDTNKFNSEMLLKADMANQAVRNSNRELRYKSGVAAAQLRQQIDAQAAAGRSANLTNLFDSLGNIGREEVMKSWINQNPALYYAISTGGKGTPYSQAEGGYLTIKKRGRRKK